MRTPAMGVASASAPANVSRKCAACQAEEEEKLQKKEAATAEAAANDAPASVHEVLRSQGQPLDGATRPFFEPRFGYDFTGVRVHTGASAEQSARAMNAHAYTVGHNIVFGAGQYAPSTHEGQKLLAHELSHVVQQTARAAGALQRSPDDKEKEKTEEKPTAKFAGCNKDQQSAIEEAIKQAEGLASRALQALERDFPLTGESTAMKANFGDPSDKQKATIIERYKQIQANLGSKTYTCEKKGEKAKEGKELVDLCAKASCPGSKITVFPDFGKETCPAGPVILHEAAHNAGACDDHDKGKAYPPARPENNAYSYEYFASDVAAGPAQSTKSKKHEPHLPK
jgi:hypothetical protein